MISLIVILLVFITTVLASLVATRVRPVSARILIQTVASLFDFLGLVTVFIIANLALGIVIVLIIRGFTPRFVSVDEFENFLLPLLSAVQAFVFHQWVEARLTASLRLKFVIA